MDRENAKITKAGIALALVFLVLVSVFPGGAAIEIINGLFVGVAVVVYLTFRHVTVDTLLGRGEYKGAQQMALALAIMWVGLAIRTAQSIAYRSTDNAAWILDLPFGALATYLFTISGVMMVTAPNLGDGRKGYFHGQSKSRIIAAVVVGIIVAGFVAWFQRVSMSPLAR